MKLATFNVRNFFERPAIMNLSLNYQDKNDNDWLPPMRCAKELMVESTSEEPWKTS